MGATVEGPIAGAMDSGTSVNVPGGNADHSLKRGPFFSDGELAVRWLSGANSGRYSPGKPIRIDLGASGYTPHWSFTPSSYLTAGRTLGRARSCVSGGPCRKSRTFFSISRQVTHST